MVRFSFSRQHQQKIFEMTFQPFDDSPIPGLSLARDFIVGLESQALFHFSFGSVFPTLDFVHAVNVCLAHRALGGKDTPWPQAVRPQLGIVLLFLIVCLTFLKKKTIGQNVISSPLLQLAAVILAGLGGTLITNVVLLAQPASWLAADAVLPTYITVFAVDRWCPGDLFHRIVSWSPLYWLLTALGDASWATSITAWGANKALTAEHVAPRRSAVLTILSGFFSGCGGGLLHSGFCLTDKQWRFQCPAGIATSTCSFAVRLSMILSLFFYLSTNPHNYLPYAPLLSPLDARMCIFIVIFTLDACYSPETMRRFAKMGSLGSNRVADETQTKKDQ